MGRQCDLMKTIVVANKSAIAGWFKNKSIYSTWLITIMTEDIESQPQTVLNKENIKCYRAAKWFSSNAADKQCAPPWQFTFDTYVLGGEAWRITEAIVASSHKTELKVDGFYRFDRIINNTKKPTPRFELENPRRKNGKPHKVRNGGARKSLWHSVRWKSNTTMWQSSPYCEWLAIRFTTRQTDPQHRTIKENLFLSHSIVEFA